MREFTRMVGKDGIRSIDNPQFVSVKKAQEMFFEFEPVVVVQIMGNAKAYPLSILQYHEIVNDKLDQVPISVTYCPLCNSSIVFSREVEGSNGPDTLEFGVSGMLRNSDLVMWDRQTESWWQQTAGEALVGSYAGTILDQIPSAMYTFQHFSELFPHGSVLLPDTLSKHDHNHVRFVNYDNEKRKRPSPLMWKKNKRLTAMERVIAIYGNVNKIYPMAILRQEMVINDNHEGRAVTIFFEESMTSMLSRRKVENGKTVGTAIVFDARVNGKTLLFSRSTSGFIDNETGSIWGFSGKCFSGKWQGQQLKMLRHTNMFAFAWLAHDPDAIIYSAQKKTD